ncbi:hypothetical protein [Chlamydia sp. 17-3921]|uniref:hypothetical protein n=1 Tax=Chlamydia sp. 17-3921 TaxID=2675798 RepID=UPI00191A9203|nr:hypothetical protein [Chlamydia sp. 17-3921]
MSCFNLQAVNEALKPVCSTDFPDTLSWKNSVKRIIDSNSVKSVSVTPKYQVSRKARILAVVMGVIAVIVLLAIALGSLKSHALTLTWPAIVIAILLPTVLIVGGMFILFRIGKRTDILSGTKIKPFGERCWVPMPLYWENKDGVILKNNTDDCYADLSTLDTSGSGIALVYSYPRAIEDRVPTFVFPFIGTPFFVLLRMVYNLIRAIVIPFYILLRMLIDKLCFKELSKEEHFTFTDIFREEARSCWNVLKAPFYGSAYYMTLFYGLLDPLVGRVSLARLERSWNDHVIRSRGFWLLVPQRFFRFEGGGGRYGLGQQAFYSMGCFQPQALLLFHKGNIVSGGSASLKYSKENSPKAIPAINLIPEKESCTDPLISNVQQEIQNTNS